MFASLPGIGEPEGTPERPDNPPAFPAVHDMPPPRESKPLTEEERKKLSAELEAVRSRQGSATPKSGQSSKQ